MNQPIIVTEVLSVLDYAERAGKNHRTVREWLRRGKLPTAYQDTAGKWWIPAGAEPIADEAEHPTPAPAPRAGAEIVPMPAPEIRPAFTAGYRICTPADAAAALGMPDLPAATIVRWARTGSMGMELLSGPAHEHLVAIPSAR